jgi:hypothetical protein
VAISRLKVRESTSLWRNISGGFKALKVRDVLKWLAQDGWVLVRTKGSHRQLKHPQKKL